MLFYCGKEIINAAYSLIIIMTREIVRRTYNFGRKEYLLSIRHPLSEIVRKTYNVGQMKYLLSIKDP